MDEPFGEQGDSEEDERDRDHHKTGGDHLKRRLAARAFGNEAFTSHLEAAPGRKLNLSHRQFVARQRTRLARRAWRSVRVEGKRSTRRVGACRRALHSNPWRVEHG